MAPQGIGHRGSGHAPELSCRTAYPFEETISVEVDPARPASFPLYFRIPGWCAKPRIAVNRVPLAAVADGKGFVRIERRGAGET